MDINDLKRKIKAQKSMSLELGKIRVDLIIPSDFDVQLQAVKAGLGEKNKPEAMLLFKRAVTESAVTGWTGVTVGYLTNENQDDVVDFDQQLVGDFLDANKNNYDTISEALLVKVFERREIVENAKKN